MATYSNPSFDSSNYQTNRPGYKDSLVDAIIAFHQHDSPGAATDLAVDVATGTGIFARQLRRGFAKVIGTDISDTMLKSARAVDTSGQQQQQQQQQQRSLPIDYVECAAESMPFLPDHSVDVITVATGAHWFDVDKFVAEAKRILKPNGTLAILGYTGFAHFADHPQCDQMYKEYGLGDKKIGSYWDSGREHLVEGYRIYHKALLKDSWQNVERRVYPGTAIEGEPSQEYPPTVIDCPAVMDFNVSWRSLESFLSTWSALAKYHNKHPDEEKANQVLVQEMMEAAGSKNKDEKLNMQWEEVLLLARPPVFTSK